MVGLSLVGDSRRLDPISTGSVGVIVTSPPYWMRGRGRDSAERWARTLAQEFGAEWRRVLAPDGDLWLVIGDRHDGAEWLGLDGIVSEWMRRTGWRLQSKGCWAQVRSRERWDNRLNHVLRFRNAGRAVRPDSTTLCWMLRCRPAPREPLGRHPRSRDPHRPGEEQEAGAGAGPVHRCGDGRARGAGRRSRVDRSGAGSADGAARGAAPRAAASRASRQDSRVRIFRTSSW
jgi:hypothetical protein